MFYRLEAVKISTFVSNPLLVPFCFYYLVCWHIYFMHKNAWKCTIFAQNRWKTHWVSDPYKKPTWCSWQKKKLDSQLSLIEIFICQINTSWFTWIDIWYYCCFIIVYNVTIIEFDSQVFMCTDSARTIVYSVCTVYVQFHIVCVHNYIPEYARFHSWILQKLFTNTPATILVHVHTNFGARIQIHQYVYDIHERT